MLLSVANYKSFHCQKMTLCCLSHSWRKCKRSASNCQTWCALQMLYSWAFGLRPLCARLGVFWSAMAALVYSYLYPGLSGVMTYLVLVYISLIAVTAWRAVARVQFFGDLWTWTKLCAFAGSLLFIVSDFVIAVDKFRHPVPYSHQIIMVTYYAAQLGITLSVVDSQVDALLETSVAQWTQPDTAVLLSASLSPVYVILCFSVIPSCYVNINKCFVFNRFLFLLFCFWVFLLAATGSNTSMQQTHAQFSSLYNSSVTVAIHQNF